MADAPPDFADPRYFERVDTEPDTDFYRIPRLVIHVDEHASAALADWFAKTLPTGGDILDLMSAWRSHLPAGARYRSVTGHGMNVTELNENPALTARLIQDLNALPTLPFKDASFDAVLISFSMQYLTQPIAVLREIARVLRPGGRFHAAYSNRLFPTKAVAVWQACSDAERAHLIAAYLRQTGGFTDLAADRLVDAATGYDPLYVVSAAKI
jgi:SAM-dependent methyltransferase